MYLNIVYFPQLQDYQCALCAMQNAVRARTMKKEMPDQDMPDEVWLMQHHPVFTQGQAGRAEHVLDPHHIPVVQSDRGGQITYHGPGQLMVYTLFDLSRLGCSVRDFVYRLEHCIISYLRTQCITAHRQKGAPGVYVEHHKICSIGLRVRKGCSYHGVAFNIMMDTQPFQWINPCGYPGLKMTQLSDFCTCTISEVACVLMSILCQVFSYSGCLWRTAWETVS